MRREHGFRDELGGIAFFVLQSRAPGLFDSGYLAGVNELFKCCLAGLDSYGQLDAVDCAIVILDYVDGVRWQRPLLALNRMGNLAGAPNVEGFPAWTDQCDCLDYILSQYNVSRPVGAAGILQCRQLQAADPLDLESERVKQASPQRCERPRHRPDSPAEVTPECF